MEFLSIELVIVLGVVLDMTSAYPHGERSNWGGVARRPSLRGLFLPRFDELATIKTRRPSLRDDLLPILANVVKLEAKRLRRRKNHLPGLEVLARRQTRIPRLEEVDRSEDTNYPVFINKEDIPKVLNIFENMVKKNKYKKSRRTKRGRSRAIRTSGRQHLMGNSNSMDIIDGDLSPHTTTVELSIYEQLSIELARLRCQELQRQRDALRVLEMADPSNFQHRSEHREQPC